MADAKRSSSRTAIEDAPMGSDGGGPAIREIFLSPRVVDREAFNDFSGSLRRLIEHAAGQSDGLKAASEQAGAAHQQLRDLATKHTARFEAAARAVSALDERTSKAEAMLTAAQQAAKSLDTLRADAERIIADRVAAMEQRLEIRMAESTARAEALEQRIEAFAGLVESILAEARQAISGQEARAVQSIEDGAGAARRTFDGVCELLSRHAEDLRLSVAASAEVQRERIDQQTEAAVLRAREAAKATAAAADLAESRVAALAANAQRQGEEQRRHLADMLLRAEEAAGEAETLLGLTTALPDEDDEEGCAEAAGLALPGSLADLVLKSRRHRRQAERSIEQLESTAAEAEATRGVLAESIADSSMKIGALEERAESLRGGLSESLAACERAAIALAEKKAAVEAAVNKPLADLASRTEEARIQAMSVDSQTRKARDAAQMAIERTGEIVRGLAGLLDQLRPWQPLLLEADPTAEIPPALRGLIDQVRAEIAGDLATIATGLQHVALRAQRAGAGVGAPAGVT